MARTLPAGMATALAQGSVTLFYAVEMLFDSGAIRLWTGYGDKGTGTAVAANQIQSGQRYFINSLGTTDFTLIGASSNTVGLSFVATAPGTGTGKVTFPYTGAGTLLNIDGIAEVADLNASGITISLSGISSGVISLALQENYQGRVAKVYFGVEGVSGVVEVFSGFMDVMTIQHSGEKMNVTLSIESKLVTLQRPNIRRYTSANHKLRNPGDTFFDYVAKLQDKEIVWGRKA